MQILRERQAFAAYESFLHSNAEKLEQIRNDEFYDNYTHIVKLNPFSAFRMAHFQIPKQRAMQQMLEQAEKEAKANGSSSSASTSSSATTKQ